MQSCPAPALQTGTLSRPPPGARWGIPGSWSLSWKDQTIPIGGGKTASVYFSAVAARV
jgi:hypothetical protein